MMEYSLSLRKILGYGINTIPWIVMAEEPSFRENGTPSPVSEDDNLSLGRLRVKPAMTIRRSVLDPSQMIFEFWILNLEFLNL